MPVSPAAATCAVAILLLREEGVGRGVGRLLLLLIILLQLLGVTRWREMVGSGGGGKKKGVHARAMGVRCTRGGAMGLRLGRVGAGGDGSGEIRGKLGGENSGAGGGDEIFCIESGKESFFESYFDLGKHHKLK